MLVDDGSPDNCPILCDEWALKDNRIKALHKTNGGLSDARNYGLDRAIGEYIIKNYLGEIILEKPLVFYSERGMR